MSRPCSIAAVLIGFCLALTAPATAAAATTDPLRTLGGDSPLCARSDIGAPARADCRATGAIEHPYPIDRYRFDWHIDTGITKDPVNNLLAAIQWLLSIVWLALLYLLKGVLLAFQWSFSLDLLGDAMAPARRSLDQLHQQTLGQPWFLAAITMLGLGAIWRGFVQRRTIETVAGLAAASLMMAGALFVIAQPAQTLGALSKGANDVSLGFLAGASEGTLRTPSRTIASSSRRIFDSVVLRPWCAMNFADVTWCLKRTPGDHLTHAERWLRFEPDSTERNAEFQIVDDPTSEPWKRSADVLGVGLPAGDLLEADSDAIKHQLDGYHPTKDDGARVAIQKKDQTVVRVALFLLIAAGTLGCILLLGWLAIRVLFQGLLTLVLLLGAPVMLLAPAFGQQGRTLFAAWAKRLLAAAVAKAIYALLLAIVLAVSAIIGQLDGTFPWLAVWLISAVFWWGVLLKRSELLGWLSLGAHDSRDNSIARAYYATRMAMPVASAITGGAAGATLAAPTTAIAAGRAGHQKAGERREQTEQAIQTAAREQLIDRARTRLDDRYERMHERLAAHDDAREKITGLDKRLTTNARTLDQAKTAEQRARDPQERERHTKRSAQLDAQRGKLIRQRKALEPRLMPRLEEGVARKFIETADRNQVEQGTRFSDRQVDLQLDELRGDVAAGAPPDDRRHLWRAQGWRPGIPESDLERLEPPEREDLHRHIADDLERDRALFRALPADPDLVPTSSDRRAVRAALDPKVVRKYRREAARRQAPPSSHSRP